MSEGHWQRTFPMPEFGAAPIHTIRQSVVEGVTIREPKDVLPAAKALRDAIWATCELHVTASHDISGTRPMVCDAGTALAAGVFSAAGPDRWWLDEGLALRSPLIAASRVRAAPFWCNAAGIYDYGGRQILPEINLENFAARALTHSAIVVPVHLPLGQLGVVSILSPDAFCEDLREPFDRHSQTLATWAGQFVSTYVEAMQGPSRMAGAAGLSRREVECLHWASVGKTNEETGMILGLSRATIRFHIANAARKLVAVNRDQTIFKAAQLGYLPSWR
ncbi:helix-turn-helix transcriptional regulator [Novosphingobium sp. PY1]|uniref:helix-turn-helix transcriptional regulator n=1 Tax=Novosphingobium sp. PY1 TaxID=1882221 RepID=UPI001A90B885|nr:helix-turn-helix transcriptional regulator [Novosphingobium sp. PY1]